MERSSYYLSGPMSGHENFNFETFNKYTWKLREQGYSILTPFEINPSQHRRDRPETDEERRDYLLNDIRALIECKGIILLPGWEASKGAQLEHRIACALGLEVRFIGVQSGELL